jgi:hypothetical protein
MIKYLLEKEFKQLLRNPMLAADADGNRYTFIIKAAASSMSPDMLSCYTKKINVHESLYLKSAKVLSHYENKGIKYTRIGYLKFK